MTKNNAGRGLHPKDDGCYFHNILEVRVFRVFRGASFPNLGLKKLIRQARREELAGRIRAGEYRIERGMTPRQMLDMFVAGRVQLHAVTVPEGWTFRQAFDAGVEVLHTGASVPSAPHIDMTVTMLRQAGIAVDDSTPNRWAVAPGPIAARSWTVEPDLSNAVPFLSAAVVTGGVVLALVLDNRDLAAYSVESLRSAACRRCASRR